MNKQKIDYVLFHLNLFINIDDLKNNFKFIPQNKIDTTDFNGEVIFPISDKDFNPDNILNIDNIPVLFPLEAGKEFYKIDNKNNLIFTQDLITSSFYLLSGLQEYKSTVKDKFGRFPFEISIQKKLGIINKPIVNYYFEIIVNAIKEWGVLNNVKISTKKLFENFGVLLTHDVDKIETFNFFEVGYKFKQLIGLAHSNDKFFDRTKTFFYYFYQWVNIFNKKNLHWDFDQIRNTEKKYNFNSVFLFLQKDKLHADSYYLYSDKKIKDLFLYLNEDNCEIGLHGTINSAKNLDSLQNIFRTLESESPQRIFGVRQHRLIFENTLTSQIQEKTGLKYDSSLGFAEHEGFRNSFCHPFKIYDHENDKMLNIWEFPLIAMDTTLFKYRKLSVVDALINLNEIIIEIKKFNGLFTFLWHNGFQVDNQQIYDIESFYEKLLKSLHANKGKSILGKQLLQKLQQEEDNA